MVGFMRLFSHIVPLGSQVDNILPSHRSSRRALQRGRYIVADCQAIGDDQLAQILSRHIVQRSPPAFTPPISPLPT